MKNLPKEDQKKVILKLKKARSAGKKTVYSSMYGIGKEKLSRELKIPTSIAKNLLDAYWAINWSIKEISKTFETRIIDGQLWVKNPVSGFWHSLRSEKDVWSTINQSTGVYCFDKWLSYIRRERPQLTAQFHDEGIWEVRKGHTDKMRKLAQDSIDKVNKELNLNVTLTINTQVGDNYSDIH